MATKKKKLYHAMQIHGKTLVDIISENTFNNIDVPPLARMSIADIYAKST